MSGYAVSSSTNNNKKVSTGFSFSLGSNNNRIGQQISNAKPSVFTDYFGGGANSAPSTNTTSAGRL